MKLILDNADIQGIRAGLIPMPASSIRDGLVSLLGGLKFSNGRIELNQKVLGPVGASLSIEVSVLEGSILIDIQSAKAGVGSVFLGFFGLVRKKAGNILFQYLNVPGLLQASRVDGNIKLSVTGLNVSSCKVVGNILELGALLD